MIILIIRDFSDSVNFEKMQLKLKEEKVSQIIVTSELNKIFHEHSNAIDKVVDRPKINFAAILGLKRSSDKLQ